MTPKEWRESQKLTLEELAAKLGRTKGYVSLLENGKRKPSFDVLKTYEVLSGNRITSKNFHLYQ